MSRRRGLAALAALVALVVVGPVAGCASIPTDSEVIPGGQVYPDRPVRELVAGPATGAQPAEVVHGFLEAVPGAPDEYAVARSFLTPDRAGRWRPERSTVIYSDDAPMVKVTGQVVDVPSVDVPGGAQAEPVRASVSVTVVATVDSDGRYVPAPTSSVLTVDLVLKRVAGQWRIDELPDLVLISEPDFGFQYRSYQLWFLDPTREVLVPETRSLPNTGATVTRLVTELLDGASPWLAQSVRTAVPAGTALAPPRSVTTDRGTAVLELTGQARVATAPQRALMRAQLLATLQPVLGVSDVELRVDGGQLDVPSGVPLPQVGVQAVGDPVMVDDTSLVRLSGSRLDRVEPVADIAGLGATDPGASLDGTRFAVLTSERSQLRVLQLGTAEPAEVLLTGFDLTAPSFDRQAWVWTTSATSDGTVSAVSPAGEPVSVEASWLAGRRVGSLRVSRDGTRVAVASTDGAGLGYVDVAGIVRSEDGTPTLLQPAPSRSIATHLVTVDEAVWIDGDELAVLGSERSGEALRVYPVAVGGPRRPPRSEYAGMTGIAGGLGLRSLLVTVQDGSVLTPSGPSWRLVLPAGAARDPAYPG